MYCYDGRVTICYIRLNFPQVESIRTLGVYPQVPSRQIDQQRRLMEGDKRDRIFQVTFLTAGVWPHLKPPEGPSQNELHAVVCEPPRSQL